MNVIPQSSYIGFSSPPPSCVCYPRYLKLGNSLWTVLSNFSFIHLSSKYYLFKEIHNDHLNLKQNLIASNTFYHILLYLFSSWYLSLNHNSLLVCLTCWLVIVICYVPSLEYKFLETEILLDLYLQYPCHLAYNKCCSDTYSINEAWVFSDLRN